MLWIYILIKTAKYNYKSKNKQHGIRKKKNPGKKLNEIYIVAFHFVWGTSVICLALFTSGKAVQLTCYEFSTYLYQLQPHSVV